MTSWKPPYFEDPLSDAEKARNLQASVDRKCCAKPATLFPKGKGWKAIFPVNG